MTYRAPSWQTLTITAVAALAVSALMAFSRPVTMIVDGLRIDSDVPPITTHATEIFVPLRTLASALGAQTIEDDHGRHVDVVRGNRMLHLRVGETRAALNGMPMTLSHAPFRVRGRVMIELNAVARAFNVRASYDPRTSQIEVLSNGVGGAPETKDDPSITRR